jgi:hypothetical protein
MSAPITDIEVLARDYAPTRPRRPPIYHDDHIEIPLTKGRVAIVDLDCPPAILSRSWCSDPPGYAISWWNGANIRLHRALLGLPATGDEHVDHRDGDRSNNRRSNLRVCTRKQNAANQGPTRGATSRFRGVCWDKQRGKWRAALTWKIAGKVRSKCVGRFTDEEEAARAWDAAAVSSGLYDPKFLRLNFAREVSP